jgi:hypothetical protein
MTPDAWGAIATGAAALFAAVGAGLVVAQLYLARTATREEYANRRRQAAIDFYAQTIGQRDQWNLRLPPDRDEAAISVLVNQALAPSGEATEQARRAIHNYLGFWELLSAGVAKEVLDRDTIRSLARGRAVAVWNNYRPFVIAERIQYEAGLLYRELQNLAESLAAEQQGLTATVSLRAQPGCTGSGLAIAQATAGGTEIRLNVKDLPATGPGQFYECWYAGPDNRPEHPELVAAGTFIVHGSGSHTFHMWCAADPARFMLMQITLEQLGDAGPRTVILAGTAQG